MAERKTLDEVEAKASEAAAGHRERLTEVARGVEQRYQRVAEEMKREAERASQAAKQKVEGAARQLRQGYAQASKTAGTVAEDVADFVRDNPRSEERRVGKECRSGEDRGHREEGATT